MHVADTHELWLVVFQFAIGSWFSIIDDGHVSEMHSPFVSYNHSVKTHKEEATLGPLMLGLILYNSSGNEDRESRGTPTPGNVQGNPSRPAMEPVSGAGTIKRIGSPEQNVRVLAVAIREWRVGQLLLALFFECKVYTQARPFESDGATSRNSCAIRG